MKGDELHELRELHLRLVEDYDRRRDHWWGRLLLWLLNKTT